MKFIDDGGAPEVAVGEFSQSHDVVSGTILTTTGDHRYLAGQVKGDELYLSTFDGAHVFLYKAKIAADGSLDGDWWSGLAFHEKWIGKRDAAARLPDAYGVTAMRDGVKQFRFCISRPFWKNRLVQGSAISRQGTHRGAGRQLVPQLP